MINEVATPRAVLFRIEHSAYGRFTVSDGVEATEVPFEEEGGQPAWSKLAGRLSVALASMFGADRRDAIFEKLATYLPRLQAGEMKVGPSDEEIAGMLGFAPPPSTFKPGSAMSLYNSHPHVRPPLIAGLLRLGEIANIIAQPKTGKTWAAMWLAIAVATGRSWFGHQCTPGKVLIIDNELHKETLAHRLKWAAESHGLSLSDLGDRVQVISLRGQLIDINQMRQTVIEELEPEYFSLIVLDSLYRAIPKGLDENANSDMTTIYNTLDAYARRTGAAIAVIHHTSKGVQGSKGITDVGSGASAQARAADAHVVLRQHAQEGVLVLDAVVRSFPPTVPTCWRIAVPLFTPDTLLDPCELRTEGKRKKRETEEDEVWTPHLFAQKCLTAEPQILASIRQTAKSYSISEREYHRLIDAAIAHGYAAEDGGKGKAKKRVWATEKGLRNEE